MIWQPYHAQAVTQKYLYKFLCFDDLSKFLGNGRIWFSRADVFGDKMECVRITDINGDRPDIEKIETRKKRYLISCWHAADRESLVLWDTHSESPEKRRTVGIRFLRSDLIELMHRYVIKHKIDLYHRTTFRYGKVLYRDLINIERDELWRQAVKYPAFRKEAGFAYESEYRFVIQLPWAFHDAGYGFELGLPIELPITILVNPLLKKEMYQETREKIQSLGYGNKLKDSELTRWMHPELW